MPKAAVWIIAAALALAAISSLWFAGEMHYRNCLAQEEAEAKVEKAVGLRHRVWRRERSGCRLLADAVLSLLPGVA